MKRILKICITSILCLIMGYFIVGYISSYIGWYGYKKWSYRVGTSSIETSKKRGVFIKELHYQIDSFSGKIDDFHAYIEKGFKYGHHSEEETILLTNTNYPYQLSFGYNRYKGIGVLLRKDQLKKFDSSNLTQGFLKYPNITDTIILDIGGEDIHAGRIRIWQ